MQANYRFLACFLPVVAAAGLAGAWVPAARAAESDGFELALEVREGKGDKPMIAVWLEDEHGAFVKTLTVCSQARKHYRQLTAWQTASRGKETPPEVDAVVGATISWARTRVIHVPAQLGSRRLLDGGLVIRIESVVNEGKHYRDFRIPIPRDFRGGAFEDQGYVTRAIFRIPGETGVSKADPRRLPPEKK